MQWITDPPYASGGTKQNERTDNRIRNTAACHRKKPCQILTATSKDQRSWTHWMAEWLYDVRKACKSGAPICLFIDWRQYPSMTDALQWAGWIWRGTAVWDKTNSRPQKGRFRQQTEFIIWGSNQDTADQPSGFLSSRCVPIWESPEPGACDRETAAVDEGRGAGVRARRKNLRSFCRSRYYDSCGCPAGIPGGGIRSGQMRISNWERKE